MVCLGNICRSPMAEGILRKLSHERNIEIVVDSAGTGNWHVGEHPDHRAIATAGKFGVDISNLVARQFGIPDFERFDKIFVMDKSNLSTVAGIARTTEHKEKIDLLLNQSDPHSDAEVPDPWFGDADGFLPVYRMMEIACINFLNSLEKNPPLR